jgi:hypothetical protein
MDANDIPWLHACLDKVEWTIQATSVHDRLDELRSMLISKIDDLGGNINLPPRHR